MVRFGLDCAATLAAWGLEFLWVTGLFRTSRTSIPDEIAEFAKINSGYWKKAADHGNSHIVVESYLAYYGPNYVLRSGIVAKAIEEATGCIPIVLVHGFEHSSHRTIEVYSSFGIRQFFFLRRQVSSIPDFVRALLGASKFLIFPPSIDELLNLRWKSIHIGDLVYDEILHSRADTHTINSWRRRDTKFLLRAIFAACRYGRIFRKYPVAWLVTSHIALLEYGILTRVALHHGARVVETTDISTVMFKPQAGPMPRFWPNYTEGVRAFLARRIPELEQDPAAEERALKLLDERLSGRLKQLDVQMASQNKRLYSRHDLCAAFGWKQDRPIVFVFAHVLNDIPHMSSSMLFRDYFAWIEQTIRFVGDLPCTSWIIKAHPASQVYREAGVIDDLVRSLGREHVKLCPEDFHNGAVPEIAAGIVTVHGTVGIEYSCLGIPVVIAGKAFYSGMGFTIEPESVEEYRRALANIGREPRLTDEQRKKARIAFAAFDSYLTPTSAHISTDILMHVWGYGGERNPLQAYREVNKQLSQHDPRTHPAWRRTWECIREE